MDYKGQISVEYLLLIVVILIILGSVTLPLIGRSIDASNDISWTSDAKNAVSTIANAVNIVYSNGPQAKRTLTVYIPKNGMNFNNTSNLLGLTYKLSDGLTNKTVNSTIYYPVTTNPTTLNKGWYNVVVYWTVGQSSINVNLTST
jgi:uncharacterized protein (UPF0333 family)